MKEKIILTILRGFAILPLGVLYILSDVIFIGVYYILGYRKKLVRKNIGSSFPEKSEKEIKRIERKFYRYLSDLIVETLKILHISDKELKKRVHVKDYERINESLRAGKNVALLMGHYGNWEWVQEITKYLAPEGFMISIYHPLSSKLWDDIFKKIRSRWHAHIVPSTTATRTLLTRNNMPWVCGFIADQRPGKKTPENCVEFLHHPTYFAYGTEEISKKVNADFFYLEMLRKGRGKYEIRFYPIKPEDVSMPYPYTRGFWKEFEKTIQAYPAYWLWSHNRWK